MEGFYKRLGDSSLSVKERVSLAEKVWNSDNIYLPNKRQVLIDALVSMFISGKKEQEKDKTEKNWLDLWKCMHRFLKESQAVPVRATGKPLFLKPSTAQMTLKTLELCDEDKQTCDLVQTVVDCCDIICSTTSLSYVFTSNIDILIQLMGSLSKHMYRLYSDDETPPSSFFSVLNHFTKEATKKQKSVANQKQVFLIIHEKLLLPVLLLNHRIERKCGQSGCKNPCSNLYKFMLDALFEKEHKISYTTHLSSLAADSPMNQRPPKHVITFYETLSNLLRQTEDCEEREAVLPFLASFCERFFKFNEYTMNHSMVKFIFSLLGIDTQHTFIEVNRERLVVKGVRLLLEVVQSCNVYDVAQDNTKGSHHLHLYRHLINLLLICIRKDVDWYRCLLYLLDMNHNILEQRLDNILVLCWRPVSCPRAQSSLFIEILNTYAKIRQVPKWLDKLLLAFKLILTGENITLSSRFISRFAEVAENLPQATTIEIWKKFSEQLKSGYCTLEGVANSSSLNAITFLFYIFLRHVRIIEYGITDMTLKKVEELLNDLHENILPALFCLSKENSNHLFPLLLIAEIYGGMKLLLAQYGRYEANLESDPHITHISDISFLHTYLTAEEWISVYDRCKELQDRRNSYLWDCLLIQKLKYFALYVDKNSTKLLQSIIEVLLPPSSDIAPSDLRQKWDGCCFSIDEKNALVVKWSLVYQYLPLVQSLMSRNQTIELSKFAIRTLMDVDHREVGVANQDKDGVIKEKMVKNPGANVEDQGGMETGEDNEEMDVVERMKDAENEDTDMDDREQSSYEINLTDITEVFLKDAIIHENGPFLSSLVTVLWGNLHESNRSTSSPKKRKLNTEMRRVLEVLEIIGDENTVWYGEMSELRLQEIEKAAGKVDEILQLESLSVCSVKMSLSSLHTCIKILSKITIQNLTESDVMRCILGCLCILTVLMEQLNVERSKAKESTELQTDLLEEITLIYIDICAILFESSRRSSLFLHLKPSVFLKWMENLHSKVARISEKFPDRLYVLMSTASLLIVQDFRVVKLLGPTLDNIFSKLKSFKKNKVTINICSSTLWMLQQLTHGFDKMRQRKHLPDEASDIITEYLKKTCKHFLALLPVYLSCSDDTINPVHEAVLSVYCHITSFCCHVKESDAELQIIEENFGKMFGLVTLKLHQQQISTNLTLSCLQVLKCWCVNSLPFSKLLTESVKCELWSLLCDLLLTNLTVKVERQLARGKRKIVQPSFNTSLSYILHGSKKDEKSQETEGEDRTVVYIDKETSIMSSVGITKYKRSKDNLVISKIENVMRRFLMMTDETHFGLILMDLEVKLNPEIVLTDREDISLSIHVLQQLLDYDLAEEKYRPLLSFLSRAILNFQSILQLSEKTTDETFIKDICVPILNTETKILNLGQSGISKKTFITCLHGLQFVPLDKTSHFVFVPSFSAIYEVLNSLMINHTKQLEGVTPTILNCTSRLLKAVIHRGSQDDLTEKPEYVDDIVKCANLTERLLTLLSTHKLEFAKVAVYIIADYVTEIQKVTLLPVVKKSLINGIYNVLALCDVHGVSLLESILHGGVRDVFKVLYTDYYKYHKYTGRI